MFSLAAKSHVTSLPLSTIATIYHLSPHFVCPNLECSVQLVFINVWFSAVPSQHPRGWDLGKFCAGASHEAAFTSQPLPPTDIRISAKRDEVSYHPLFLVWRASARTFFPVIRMAYWLEEDAVVVQRMYGNSPRLVDPLNFVFQSPSCDAFGLRSSLIALDPAAFFKLSNFLVSLQNSNFELKKGGYRVRRALKQTFQQKSGF